MRYQIVSHLHLGSHKRATIDFYRNMKLFSHAIFSTFFVIFVVHAWPCEDMGGTCMPIDKIVDCNHEIEVDPDLCSTSRLCCLPRRSTPVPTTPEPKPTQNDPNCGLRKTQPSMTARIIGGVDADFGELPWQVSIKYFGSHVCGGSILSDQYIVSAAHCFRSTNPSTFMVTVGEFELSDKQNIHQKDHRIQSIIIHPEYNSQVGSEGDIALLKLVEKIDFSNKYVNMVCLPENPTESYSGQNCTVSGWGMTNPSSSALSNRLQKMNGPIMSNHACNNAWGSDFITKRHLCQYREDASACKGDSGGPLQCRKDGRFEMVGVVSFGPSNCQYKPAVYTRTTAFLDWINGYIHAEQ